MAADALGHRGAHKFPLARKNAVGGLFGRASKPYPINERQIRAAATNARRARLFTGAYRRDVDGVDDEGPSRPEAHARGM